jgi:protein MAK16
MQQDAVIWDIINHSFCSFKTKVAKERTFCQNEYNVTGLCIRSACPLANASYATIREEDGVCYLFQKTAERAHSPKNLWEKIKLPANYAAALELVSKELEHYPVYLQHRNKQRLTKIHQMIIRMRKLKLKARPKLVTINTKVDRREVGKERKALKAAQLDRAIENELLERLKQVSDGEIYNYPQKEYSSALSRANNKYKDSDDAEVERDVDDEGEEEDEEEYEGEEGEREMEDELEEAEGEGAYNVEYVEDFDESDDEFDVEEAAAKVSAAASNKRKPAAAAPRAPKKKGPRIEIEYEEEEEGERDTRQKVGNFNF